MIDKSSRLQNKAHQKLISEIINKYIDVSVTYVFLFGSRATRTGSPTSDYDIGLYGREEIPAHNMFLIKDEIEESNIPVFVDVVDFKTVTDEFKKIALEKIEIWNKPTINLKLN